MLGISSSGSTASKVWLDLDEGVTSHCDTVVCTGVLIIASKDCGNSMIVTSVVDSTGSIGVEQHSMSGIVRYGCGVMSTGISIAGVNARCCLEPVACDEDPVNALVLSSTFS